MPLILNIDTAVESASVCLADGAKVIKSVFNPNDRDSAAWLHPAIDNLLKNVGVAVNELEAVAVSAGPGSYTGLRVGMAAAKGLCYALNIPLISVPTLQMMAAGIQTGDEELICPMIDARRMEVFTALYDAGLNEVWLARNLVLEEGCFETWLRQYNIVFCGNGSAKARPFLIHDRARFVETSATAEDMAALAWRRFTGKDFSGLAYSEPFYGKEFHSPLPKRNL